ncbi:MAG TPA: hypothetical protein VGM18_11675 [Candidatus Sulfotelmatobacter sp.]|jgi:outer membrane lipoprotein-sorting protein
MKFSSCVFLVLSLFTGFAACQGATAPLQPASSTIRLLTVDEIVSGMVERNLERARALSAYEGTRIYRLEYRGFLSSHSAEMVVDVKYRSPGTKEFSIRSEKGSKVIIDRVFSRMLQTEQDALSQENQNRIALNPNNYRFTLAGSESTPTGPAYVLIVEPLNDNKLLYRGRIWVDAEDFAVVRVEGSPAKNPSFWTKETKIEQIYAKVGNFWLPAANQSSSDIRLGGHANFTIEYRDYQVTSAAPLSTPREARDPNRVAPLQESR